MQTCPDCGRIYDESESAGCPYCHSYDDIPSDIGEEEYTSEDDYYDSLKCADSYHFSIPFQYIAAKRDDYDVEEGTAYMEVDVTWSDLGHQYSISYYCPQEGEIDSSLGNESIDSFFSNQVYDNVLSSLSSEGVDLSCVQAW